MASTWGDAEKEREEVGAAAVNAQYRPALYEREMRGRSECQASLFVGSRGNVCFAMAQPATPLVLSSQRDTLGPS